MSSTTPVSVFSLEQQVDRFEESLIREALAVTGGDVRAAARWIRTPERTFWRRMERHEIDPGEYRDRIAGGPPRKSAETDPTEPKGAAG